MKLKKEKQNEPQQEIDELLIDAIIVSGLLSSEKFCNNEEFIKRNVHPITRSIINARRNDC